MGESQGQRAATRGGVGCGIYRLWRYLGPLKRPEGLWISPELTDMEPGLLELLLLFIYIHQVI